jgi:glycosyltransferase involved in cell wall biosynthesis
VGFVGRFGFWRGMHALMAAVAAVAAATPHAHFVLIGDGQLMPDVRRFIGERNLGSRVTLTGGLPPAAVPAHVAALDVGVLAGSPWYSSPIKLFEYGAAGLAVVAPRVPAVEEVLADGSEGILVAPEDAPALAAAVLSLVADESRRRALGERYHARVCAEFTWARVASRVTDLLLSSPRRGGRS